jgi:hypothetical protein
MITLVVSFLIFAFTMTPEIQMVIVTNLVILAGGVGKLAWDIHLGRKAKVQRELDLAAAAAERESAAKEREQTRLDQLQQREQDRLDAESKARILQAEVINQARLIAAEGAKRESRIVEKIDENTAMNAEQIKISNGHKEDIKTAVRTAETLAKAISQKTGIEVPQEIHVTVEQKQPT